MKYYLYIFLAYLAVMSVAAFFTYHSDKRKAKKGERRIPEKTLLWTGFLGGAAGALAAMEIFRHKTKHTYFYIVNVAGLLWQAAVVLFLVIKI